MCRRVIRIVILGVLLAGCTATPTEAPVDPAVDPKIAPRVSATVPPLNSQGPYAGWDTASTAGAPSIMVTFNKVMNEQSVRQSIVVRSSLRPLYVPLLSILADAAKRTFTLTPTMTRNGSFSPYLLGEILTMSLSSAAQDVNRNILPAGVIGTLEPEPHFRVRRMVLGPQSWASTPVAVPLVLEFNSPVDSSILSVVRVTPDTAVTWSIQEGGWKLVASIDYPLAGEDYAVTVAEGALDYAGHASSEPFVGRYHAGPFAPIWTSPTDEAVGVSLIPQIAVRMSEMLDSASLHTGLHLSPAVPVSYNAFVPGNEIHCFPVDPLLPGTTYTVTVDATVRSASGHQLGSPYSFTFTTAVAK